MKIKLLSLFSGIGAFEKALDRLNIDYELVNYCEIDKYASKSYSLVHGVPESKNLGDITKVDTSKFPKDIDLITYGFPCQDISLAGKQQGFTHEDGTTTRSGLFFEALRIIADTKPRIAIAENVKNLVSKKFSKEFQIVLDSLDKVGYNSYYQVLNAKDYGIPQNRERVFIISIRKDIDPYNILQPFEFPRPIKLEKRLKDMLEEVVDEKYYLSDAMMNYFIYNEQKQKEKGNGFRFGITDGDCVAKTITTRAGSRMDDNFIKIKEPKTTEEVKLIQAATLKGGKWDKINESCRRVYDEEGLSPTIHTCQGGNTEPKILIKNATQQGYLEATEGDGINISGRMQYQRGNVQKGMAQTLKASGIDVGVVVGSTQKNAYVGTTEGVSPTLTEAMGKGGGHVPMVSEKGSSYLRNFGSKGKLQDNDGVSCTLLADMGTGGGNVPLVKYNLWTKNQAKMITKDLNIKRYINSNKIDQFNEGQVADISFPNGYDKGNRVHDECPTINATTTQTSFIVKVKDKVGNEFPLYKDTKALKETIETNEFEEGKVLNLDLYNHLTNKNSQTITDGKHNSQRLFDGLRIRKLTPKECWRLMGFEDSDFAKVDGILSNTQLYKQAGNSIVVDVLMYLLKELFKE